MCNWFEYILLVRKPSKTTYETYKCNGCDERKPDWFLTKKNQLHSNAINSVNNSTVQVERVYCLAFVAYEVEWIWMKLILSVFPSIEHSWYNPCKYNVLLAHCRQSFSHPIIHSCVRICQSASKIGIQV